MTATPDTKLGAIGRPLRRKEDERLLTGRGQFTDDFHLPNQAYLALLRSTHPHATFKARIEAAKAVPGVLGVFTGLDGLADGMKPLPLRIRSMAGAMLGKSIAISSAKQSCDIEIPLTIGLGRCLVKVTHGC